MNESGSFGIYYFYPGCLLTKALNSCPVTSCLFLDFKETILEREKEIQCKKHHDELQQGHYVKSLTLPIPSSGRLNGVKEAVEE